MAEWIDIKAEDGTFGAYVARPHGGTGPTIVVIQEIFGVNADLRATCAELARGELDLADAVREGRVTVTGDGPLAKSLREG